MLLAAFNLVDPLAIAILLVLLGCVLLVAEVFFPSGGALGFFSAVSFLAAIYYAFVGGGFTRGLMFATGEVIGAPVLTYFALKYLPMTPIGRVLVGEAPRPEDVLDEDQRHALVGRVGVARSKMLPSGAVEIDGQMLDAVSQGQAIDPGQYVKVVEVRGNRVVVAHAPEDERPSHEDPSDLLRKPLEDLGMDDEPLA